MIALTLREHLARSSGSDLIYICLKRSKGNGGASGYCFIGKREDLPDRYLDAEVIEAFPHTVNYPGTAYRLDLVPTTKEKQGKWFYCETGLKWTLPDDRQRVTMAMEPWESLIIAIFESAAGSFRYALREAIAEGNPKDEAEFNRVLTKLNKKPRRPVGATETQIRRWMKRKDRYEEMKAALDLLDTSRGHYIIQRIKDEELVKILHPELLLISDMDERNAAAERFRAEILKERVRIKNGRRLDGGQIQI